VAAGEEEVDSGLWAANFGAGTSYVFLRKSSVKAGEELSMITLFVLMALYFLPTIVAAHRGHEVTGILLLNLFLGWTVIGWMAMLVWALAARPRCVVYARPGAYPYGRRYP